MKNYKLKILTILLSNFLLLFFNCKGCFDKGKNFNKNLFSKQDIPTLLDGLVSSKPKVRGGSAIELGKRNYVDALPKIREMLIADQTRSVRESAALAVGYYKDIESIPVLVEKLEKDPEVKQFVIIEALKRIGDERGADAIVGLLESKDNLTRLQAGNALQKMNAFYAGDKVLAQANKNKDPEKISSYVITLAHLKVKKAENYLLQIGDSTKDYPTHASVVYALGKIQSKKAIPFLAKQLVHGYMKSRENAKESLIEIKDKSALPYLFPYLKNNEKTVRMSSAGIIVQISDKSSAMKAFQLLKTGNKNYYDSTSYIIGYFRYKEARITLENLLKNKSNPGRREIAEAIGKIADKKSIPVLFSVISEPETDAKIGAIEALGYIKDDTVISKLLELTKDGDRTVSKKAFSSLSKHKTEKALQAFIDEINTGGKTNLYYMDSIRAIPGKKSLEALHKFALAEDKDMSEYAVRTIGIRKDKSSIPTLIQVLKDKSKSTNHQNVIMTLKKITDNYMNTREQWLDWYEDNY